MVDVLETPNLVAQETVSVNGDTVEKWTFEVDAATEVLARNRVRGYVRSRYPGVKNILNPEVESSGESEQGRFQQFFPETLQQERHVVSVLVVR